MKNSSESERDPELERAKSRALALDRLREKILSDQLRARRAGTRLEERIQEWMRDANAKKARRMQEDIELLGIARSLVLDEKEWRSPSTSTAADLLKGDGLSRMGLPTGLLPKWMVSVFDKTGQLDYSIVFRVEEYFLDWLRGAKACGVDLESHSAVEAFALTRIARMKEVGEPFDEEEIRGEYNPDRFNSALARPCYALGMVLSEMIGSGVDLATDAPTWWEVAVAAVLALDPMADPRPLGLEVLPEWGTTDDESTFNAREAIPVYIPDRVRRSEEGIDRLWSLVARAGAALSAKGPEDLARPLPSDSFRPVQPIDNWDLLEKRVRSRLPEDRAKRALTVLRLLFDYDEEFIPATALTPMGLSKKTMHSAAVGWGKDRRLMRGTRTYYARTALIEFVADDWRIHRR